MKLSDQTLKILRVFIFPLLITAAWFAMAQYTFNQKIDLNGDNCYYYTVASSLATGHGYSDLSKLGTPATATYPPGYPLLMAPLRMMTDSVIVQKWLNEVFVLLSLLLLYIILLRLKLPLSVAFTASFAGAFIPRLWHFSTMMMSEASFCLTGILTLYCLLRMSEHEERWYDELRSPWFYLMIVALVLNYHVRTQGLALVAGVLFCLLVRMRWASLAATIAGFAIGYLPWMLRNKLMGLSNTRYLDMVMLANPWQPEQGALTLPEFIARFFDTLRMLIFQAIPSAVMPFANVNPDQPVYTVGIYLLGGLMLVLMLIGCWQMGKIRWAMLGYFAGTLGIIAMFSTPSGNRYLTSVLPLLTMVEFIGIWWCLSRLIQLRWKQVVVPAYVLLPLLLFAKAGLVSEHEQSIAKFPIQYQQFFQIGRQIKKSTPADAVVCSRKPQMFYMYSNRPGICYKFTPDARELITHLVENQVDYVILDALGYGSTPRYLFPAIQQYPQYFQRVLVHYENTHTYLIQFDRERAQRELMTEK